MLQHQRALGDLVHGNQRADVQTGLFVPCDLIHAGDLLQIDDVFGGDFVVTHGDHYIGGTRNEFCGVSVLFLQRNGFF